MKDAHNPCLTRHKEMAEESVGRLEETSSRPGTEKSVPGQTGERLRRRNRMLGVLSGSVARYVNFPFANIDYQMIADHLREITEASVVLVHSYDDTGIYNTTEAVAAPRDLVIKGIKCLGYNPVGRKWIAYRLINKQDNYERLIRVKNLEELVKEQIPAEICRQLVSSLNCGDIYTAKLVHQGRVFGDTVIVMPAGKSLLEKDIVELFTGIVATTILRKNTEKELLESRQRYHHLIEHSRDAIFLASPQGDHLDVNPAACLMLGYKKDDLLKMRVKDIIFPVESELRLFEKMIDQGFFFGEIKLKSIDGRIIPVEINATLLPDGNYLGAVRDITERKQVEGSLRSSESFLKDIFESIQDSLFVIDIEYNLIRTNKKVDHKYKHEAPLIGKKCYRVFHGSDVVCSDCPALQVYETGESAQAVKSRKNSGGQVTAWIDLYYHPFVDASSGMARGVIIYARNVTEKLRMEHEMARLDRLNLIGEMAASLGHEIRNPLTTVRGFLQMLSSKENCLGYNTYFRLMIEELDRANSIITDFLSLGGVTPLELKQQNLVSIIKTLLPLIRADAINSGKQVKALYGDTPDIPLNEKEIRQLVLNLVRNGLEAMSPGGVLTISIYEEESQIILSVQDQGPGIAPELLEKIWSPFFTTKDNGTGLGLAVCYSIINRHKASISVETGPGGSTFIARFNVFPPVNESLLDSID